MNKNFLRAGEKLSRAFAKTLQEVKEGAILSEIEEKAVQYIKDEGGKPGFKMVDNYHWATCLNINEGVVHGVPSDRKINSGDLVSLDMGLFYQGWHSDMAYTKLVNREQLKVKSDDQRKRRFLEVGEKALDRAIKVVRPGNHIGHISKAIEKVIIQAGYQVIPRLTGHGIGRKLHQGPMIPGVLNGDILKTPIIKENMGLAIEVIYTQGSPKIKTSADGWTINTKDGKISSLFEKTIVVTSKGFKIITPYLF
jgi:methionyl aminopeptidase